MDKKKVVNDIIDNIYEMLKNNIETDEGAEKFYNWCEGGNIFYNAYEDYSEQEKKYACDIMSKISPNVDILSEQIRLFFQFYEMFENIDNK